MPAAAPIPAHPTPSVFAEDAARVAAKALVATLRGVDGVIPYDGFGTCCIGKVEVDVFSGPAPTGNGCEPSAALRRDKDHFGSSRRARWSVL